MTTLAAHFVFTYGHADNRRWHRQLRGWSMKGGVSIWLHFNLCILCARPTNRRQQSTTPKNRTAGQKWCNLSQSPSPRHFPLSLLLLLTPLCCLLFACDRKANINSTLAPRAKFASSAINSRQQQQQQQRERERQQQLATFAPRRGNFCQFIDEF